MISHYVDNVAVTLDLDGCLLVDLSDGINTTQPY